MLWDFVLFFMIVYRHNIHWYVNSIWYDLVWLSVTIVWECCIWNHFLHENVTCLYLSCLCLTLLQIWLLSAFSGFVWVYAVLGEKFEEGHIDTANQWCSAVCIFLLVLSFSMEFNNLDPSPDGYLCLLLCLPFLPTTHIS